MTLFCSSVVTHLLALRQADHSFHKTLPLSSGHSSEHRGVLVSLRNFKSPLELKIGFWPRKGSHGP